MVERCICGEYGECGDTPARGTNIYETINYNRDKASFDCSSQGYSLLVRLKALQLALFFLLAGILKNGFQEIVGNVYPRTSSKFTCMLNKFQEKRTCKWRAERVYDRPTGSSIAPRV